MSDLIQTMQLQKHQAGAMVKVDTFGAPDASRTAGTYNGVTGPSAGPGTVGTFNITVDVTTGAVLVLLL